MLNKKFNCCGVSVFISEESLKLVIILAYSPIEIKKINKNLIGRLIIEGQVRDFNRGLYAIKIVNNDNQR